MASGARQRGEQLGFCDRLIDILMACVIFGIVIAFVILFCIYLGLPFLYWVYGWSGIETTTVNRMMWHILGVTAVYPAAIVVVIIIVFLQSISRRWRRIRVFISYQHRHAELVESLARTISNRWIEVTFEPFESRAHDELITRVRMRIDWVDIVLVVPGLDASFVDAEILAASAARKPILVIHHTPDQTTPNTAFRGYPIVSLDSLEREGFEPLRRLITLVGASARDAPRNVHRTIARFVKTWSVEFVILMVTFWAIFQLVWWIVLLIAPDVGIGIFLVVLWLVGGSIALGLAQSFIRVIFTRAKLVRLVQQRTATGELTFDLIKNILGEVPSDQAILRVLTPQTLPLRY